MEKPVERIVYKTKIVPQIVQEIVEVEKIREKIVEVETIKEVGEHISRYGTCSLYYCLL